MTQKQVYDKNMIWFLTFFMQGRVLKLNSFKKIIFTEKKILVILLFKKFALPNIKFFLLLNYRNNLFECFFGLNESVGL
jgi:hypothetical protein